MQRPASVWPSGFSHPVWWCALVALAANDHLLKGSGLLPGAVTGKLSDVAGVIVAPALLAALLGAGGRSRRWLASTLVAAGLCAIKLSAASAAAVDASLHALGLSSRIWVDPTDLWALLALPIGHLLARPAAGAPIRLSPRVRSSLERSALALATLACMATTGDDKKKSGTRSDIPEIENASDETIVVVIASTEGRGGCKLYRSDRLGVLTADAFQEPRLLTIAAGKRAALATTDSEDTLDCGAASVRVADGDQVFVAWRDLGALDAYVPIDDGKRRARRVVVDGLRERYEIEVGEDLLRFELGVTPPEPTCPELPVEASLEFTPLAESQGFLEVRTKEADADGCLVVEWFQLEGDIAADSQRLCVPDWGFPFEVGEVLAVTQDRDEVAGDVLQVARVDEGEVATRLTLWNGATEPVGDRVDSVEPVDCVGSLTSCGAYARPLQLRISGHDDPLVAADELTISGKNDAETRILVGPSREVGWSAASCEGDDARQGPRYNLLELRTF